MMISLSAGGEYFVPTNQTTMFYFYEFVVCEAFVTACVTCDSLCDIATACVT